MKQHSILPPSASGIWGAPNGCTGWVTLNQQFPPPEAPLGSPRSTGTAEHWWAEGQITGLGANKADQAPNGEPLTEEMKEAVTVYVDRVTGVYAGMQNRSKHTKVQWGVEETVDIKAVHSQCFGTPDFYAFSEELNELYIPDYKSGHLTVDAFEHHPGICYAAGLARKFPVNNDTKIIIEIVGPRMYRAGGPISTWTCQYRDLLFYIGKLTVKAAQAVNGIEATLQTGPHCRYCDHILRCESAIQAGLGLVEMSSKINPVELTPAAAGWALILIERGLEQFKGLQSALSEQIEASIKSGHYVPGWSLKPTEGRENWTHPVETVVNMAKMYGVDISKPGSMTPAQARKAGLNPDAVAMYSKRNAGVSLVQTDPNEAIKAFGKQWEKDKLK